MRRIFQISMLCLAAGVVNACKPETEIITEDIPTAGVRFVNAVPDTGGMDFRPVDIVENTTFYNVAFKGTTLLYYKNARAGTRHFRIFRSPTSGTPAAEQIAVASTVVFDLPAEELEAGKRYTYILWGLSRPGSTPAMRVTRIVDDPPDPGANVALRVINACVPGSCGTAANGVVDVRAFTAAQTIAAPAATWTALAPLTASQYVSVAKGTYTYDVRPAGGATSGAALSSAAAPAGIAETVDIEALPGTNVSGSAVTAILFPRNVVGTQAPTIATPGMIFVWDRRPPRCATIVAPQVCQQ